MSPDEVNDVETLEATLTELKDLTARVSSILNAKKRAVAKALMPDVRTQFLSVTPLDWQKVDQPGETPRWITKHALGSYAIWFDGGKYHTSCSHGGQYASWQSLDQAKVDLWQRHRDAVTNLVSNSDQRERMIKEMTWAVSNCPHSIDAEEIRLHFSDKQQGHNALNQLYRRVENCVSEFVAIQTEQNVDVRSNDV